MVFSSIAPDVAPVLLFSSDALPSSSPLVPGYHPHRSQTSLPPPQNTDCCPEVPLGHLLAAASQLLHAIVDPPVSDGNMGGPPVSDGNMGGPPVSDGSMGGPPVSNYNMGGPTVSNDNMGGPPVSDGNKVCQLAAVCKGRN
jgi:hypothetical protein